VTARFFTLELLTGHARLLSTGGLHCRWPKCQPEPRFWWTTIRRTIGRSKCAPVESKWSRRCLLE